MNEERLQRWSAALDDALAAHDDTDLGPLWSALTQAVEADPRDAAMRRLRIRLARATHLHAQCHADLLVLHALQPADRHVLLELALLQHRWAFMLADDGPDATAEEDEAADAPEEDAADAFGDHAAIRAAAALADDPRALLEAEARRWLASLVQDHRADAAFCLQLFAGWSDAGIHAPWLRLRLTLLASAAHPRDDALLRTLAQAWDDLADQSPEGMDADKPLPMGFAADADGTLWDPFIAERAIDLCSELLARTPGDAGLLRSRGRLHQALSAYEPAAADFEAAADALLRQAPTLADDEARNDARATAEGLREHAALCRGGRPALQQASASGLEDAYARFVEPGPAAAGDDTGVGDFVREWRVSNQERLQELEAMTQALRAQAAAGPGEEQLAQIEPLARKIAGQVVGSIAWQPLAIVPLSAAAFEQDWAAALEDFRARLAALGWQELGWAEWPGLRAMLGHQAVSSIWSDPRSGTVALGFVAYGGLVVDLETEREDGRLLVTSPSRGRNFLLGGPRVDTLFVEPALPLEDTVALHLARLDWEAARTPGGSPRRCASVADAAAQQERGRQAKLHWRLAHGLTRAEALGVPHDFPDLFAPALQAAVQDALALLRGSVPEVPHP